MHDVIEGKSMERALYCTFPCFFPRPSGERKGKKRTLTIHSLLNYLIWRHKQRRGEEMDTNFILLLAVCFLVELPIIRLRPTVSRLKIMAGYTGQNLMVLGLVILSYFPDYRWLVGWAYWLTSLVLLVFGLIWRIPAVAVAIGTFYDRRLHHLWKEGLALFAPWPPWNYSYIQVDYHTRTLDITGEFQHPSRDRVKVPGSVRWHPNVKNADAVIRYLNRGGEGATEPEASGVVSKGIAELLKETVQAIIRSRIIPVSSLEEVTKMDKSGLVDPIINELTLDPSLRTASDLQNAVRNLGGVEDGFGWGIEIENVVIGDITTEGESTKAISRKRKEEYDVDADLLDVQTLLKQAELYAGKTDMTAAEAARLLEEHKTVRESGRGFTIPGLTEGLRKGGGLTDLVAALTLLGQSKGGEKKDDDKKS